MKTVMNTVILNLFLTMILFCCVALSVLRDLTLSRDSAFYAIPEEVGGTVKDVFMRQVNTFSLDGAYESKRFSVLLNLWIDQQRCLRQFEWTTLNEARAKAICSQIEKKKVRFVFNPKEMEPPNFVLVNDYKN